MKRTRPIDAVDDDDLEGIRAKVNKTIEEVDAYERELLEELPLPGTPVNEAERKHQMVKTTSQHQTCYSKYAQRMGTQAQERTKSNP